MSKYTIELNAKYVKEYASRKRAFDKAKEYAANSNNVVRIWHERNVIWDSNPEQDVASFFAATIGRKMSIYDSWNGNSMTITVESAKQLSNSVLFTGSNSWGGKSGIYVNNDCISSLVLTGEAEYHNEIDHCDVITRFWLNWHYCQ